MASNVVSIDGSILEGGGQILRNAASFSAILKIPISINNIRAGRSNPGLRPQHLMGLEIIRDVTSGKLEGGFQNSTEVSLFPQNIKSGDYVADTRTAGSVCLLIQVALPCLLYADKPSKLTLRGGTNADFAPPIDYFTQVFQPMVKSLGIEIDVELKRRGFFPKGGGEVAVTIKPLKSIKAFELIDRGEVVHIQGLSFVAGSLPLKLAHTMSQTARRILSDKYPGVPIDIEVLQEPPNKAVGNGNVIILVAETSNGCRLSGEALGKRGFSAEQMGQTAAQSLLDNLSHGGCVDNHLQDMLILPMALADGTSKLTCGEVTLHTRTAIHIAEKLAKATFDVKDCGNGKMLISCCGGSVINENIE